MQTLPTEPLQSELRDAITSLLAATDAPGVAVASVVDGEPGFAQGIGFRDADRTQTLDAHEQFYLFSITKTFIAAAVMRLTEDDQLNLDDTIQTLLPEIALDHSVTLRQLLNHTGGVPDYSALPAYFEDLRSDPSTPWTANQFLARTLPLGFPFLPGAGWAYSNIGFLLVRLAIERVTRRSLREVLADLIFAPLGLRHTFVAQTLDDGSVLTPGYSRDLDRDGHVHDISGRYHPGWVSHGVVVSSAPETAVMLDAVFSGRLLQPASVAAMLDGVVVPGTHDLFATPGYGLGLMVDLGPPAGRVAGHGGGGPGYSTAAFHFPDLNGSRVSSVALVNRDGDNIGLRIAIALAKSYDGSALQACS